MKSRKSFYGQTKNVKLKMAHCVMITKMGVYKINVLNLRLSCWDVCGFAYCIINFIKSGK